MESVNFPSESQPPDPILRSLSAGIYYSVSPQTQKPFLNLLLSTGKSVTASIDGVQWYSEGIKVKAQRSFLEILFSGKSNLVNVTSQSATPSFLGIAKPLNGAIYIIHFDDRRENSLWVFKSPFLFADSAVTILHKYLPLQRFATITLGYLSLLHDAYLCSGKKGFIVVQGGSEVVKKTLVSKEESIMVSANSLVAVEASCAIEMLSFSPAFLSFTFQDTVSFVKVTGPGTVYMSANSRRQSSSPYGEATPTVGTRIAVAIIFTLLTLYISLMVMSKFTENLENLLDEEMLAKLHNNLIPPA